MWRQPRQSLEAGDLDVTGRQFGFRIIKREKGQTDLVELYSEDDGHWHYVDSFAAFWLKDLAEVCERAHQKADTELILKI